MLTSLIKSIRYRFRQLGRRWSLKRFFIHDTAIFYGRKNVTISEGAGVWEHVVIRAYEGPVVLGAGSQVGPGCVLLSGKNGIYLAKDVMVGPNCVFAAGNHEYRKLDVPMIRAGSFSNGPIVVEEDVWIGANCTITDNVKIGRGAIVGANSLVNKSVNAFDIVAGCPAKKIGSRLDTSD